MLNLKNLDDQDYTEILETAEKQIALLTSEWTNAQESDPGVTLIELFTWLTAIERKYLNRISPQSENKLLNLLGITRRPQQGSHTWIAVSGMHEPVRLPAGVKWPSDQLVFENRDGYYLTDARFLYAQANGSVLDADEMDGRHTLPVFGQPPKLLSELTLSFDRPMAAKEKISCYLTFDDQGFTRNPVPEGQPFVELAEVSWEYLTESGWQPVNIIRDDTHGFLFSGAVVFQLEGHMAANKQGVYQLRAVLMQEQYDLAPILKRFYLNAVALEQYDTLCESVRYEPGEMQNGILQPRTYLGQYGRSILYRETDLGWQECTDCRTKSADDGAIEAIYLPEQWRDASNAILLVSFAEEAEKHAVLASGTRASGQKTEIPPADVLESGLRVLVGEPGDPGTIYHIWTPVEDFFSCGPADRVFAYDPDKRQIWFGDHAKGMAPARGRDNIRLAGLVRTAGARSNLRGGRITQVHPQCRALNMLKAEQFTPCSGGRDAETHEQRVRRAAALFSGRKRAVTAREYEIEARSTPGLLMRSVQVLPGMVCDEQGLREQAGCLTIVAQGEGNAILKPSDAYRQNILLHVNRKRLLNTRISVCWPAYIGIRLYGRVAVHLYQRDHEAQMIRAVKQYLARLNRSLGQTLCFGELYALLDMLTCVARIESMRIQPVGAYLEVTAGEDILAPRNGAYYLDSLQFDYIRDDCLSPGRTRS